VVVLALHGILGGFVEGTIIADVRINARDVIESLCAACGCVAL
jgi:hypothetical protein